MGAAQPGNYMRLMRYQVDWQHLPAVNRFMQEYAIPLSAARVKEGRIQGYSVHRPAMVSIEEAGFAQSISIILKDADAAMGGPGQMTEEWFNKALPGKSYATYIRERDAINLLRKPVATRLYEVVAVVGSMPQAAAGPSGGQ